MSKTESNESLLAYTKHQRDELLSALKGLSAQIQKLTLSGGVDVYHPDRAMLAVKLETAHDIIKRAEGQ